jgi:hypothetical protein
MRRQIGLLKSTWRISLLGLLLAGIVPAGWSQAQEKKLTQAVIRNWVIDLGAADFHAREEALASLIEAGKPAIAVLSEAVMSPDPEIAWRAATALEAIGLTGNEATLEEIKIRMEKSKGTPHRDLAQVLGTLTARWSEMQRVKAQNALVKLGATFPSGNGGYPTGMTVAAPGFMGSYASAPVVISSETIILDSFIPTPAVIDSPSTTPFDPLTVPSPLKSIIDVLEKAADADKSEDDAGEKYDSKGEAAQESDGSEDKKPKDSDEVQKEDKSTDKKELEKPTEDEEPKVDKAAEGASKEEVSGKVSDSAESTTAELDVTEVPTLKISDLSFSTFGGSGTITYGSAIPIPPGGGGPYGGISMPGVVVRLDGNWKGRDSGLIHLAGLANVNTLDIQDAPITDKAIEHIKKMPALSSILIRGTKMTPEALLKLAKEKPGVTIRGQSRGVLGINSGDPAGPCHVTALSPGAPAAAAGIQQGDVITKIDDKKVETFGHLTIYMMHKEPGDEVKITLKRGEETLEKSLKLGNREEILR